MTEHVLSPQKWETTNQLKIKVTGKSPTASELNNNSQKHKQKAIGLRGKHNGN